MKKATKAKISRLKALLEEREKLAGRREPPGEGPPDEPAPAKEEAAREESRPGEGQDGRPESLLGYSTPEILLMRFDGLLTPEEKKWVDSRRGGMPFHSGFKDWMN